MIDNETANRKYPLPDPENIASQDVERIATAITMIDEDIAACESSAEAALSDLEALQQQALRIPEDQVGIINPEIENPIARRYIVVNEDATGFTTVEGGGGEGGLKGEILVKNSDENFDTTWMDPRAVTKKAMQVKEETGDYLLQNNETIILNDEPETDNSEQFPRHGLTQRQITARETGDCNFSYIITDVKDEGIDDTSDLASKTNYGRVKIGDGINVENGVISVVEIGYASETEAGIVKIGDGISVVDGVISAAEYQQATHDTFGTVKLSDDFTTNAATGALELTVPNESIVYQAANIKVCSNNCIELDEKCGIYRLYISTDSVITFSWGFTPTKDMSFKVELYAMDQYVVSFSGDIIWELPCAGTVAGTTIIEFKRLLGSSTLYGSLYEQDGQAAVDLTTKYDTDITEDYVVSSQGNNGWCACAFLEDHDYTNYQTLLASGSDGAIWRIDFMRSTCITKVKWVNGYRGGNVSFFYIEGSNDDTTWTKLYSAFDVTIDGDLVLTKRGYFRHYRIRCSTEIVIQYFRWYGFNVDDNIFELELVTPYMTANTQGDYVLTAHTSVSDGALYYITRNSQSNYANFNAVAEGNVYWIKYELPEAKVANVIDVAVATGDADRFPAWFTVEGSNDDEEWTLILERKYINTWKKTRSEQFYVENETAFRFYKFTALSVWASQFKIARWRLYRKVDGLASLTSIIPQMSSNSQDGYTIWASSEASSDAAWKAFDNDDSTAWATTSGYTSGWIRIDLPEAAVIDAVAITARNDSNYTQAPKAFTIEGSNDGAEWTTLITEKGYIFLKGERKIFKCDNTEAFLCYRLNISENNGANYVGIAGWELGKIYRQYKRYLEELDYLVPVMNSNPFTDETGTYTITASSEHSSHKMYYLFDRSHSTEFELKSGTEGWVQIELPEAVVVNEFAIGARSDSYANATPRNYTFQVSNDGEDWITLFSVEDSSSFSSSEMRYHELENETAYKFYRLEISNPNNSVLTFARWDLLLNTTTREY